MLGRSSGAMSSEPRKFTKYNPGLSRRSLQPIYRNHSTGQQNGERKRGYMAGSDMGLNSFPSKYLYSRNFDIPHADVRPTIAHGMQTIVILPYSSNEQNYLIVGLYTIIVTIYK